MRINLDEIPREGLTITFSNEEDALLPALRQLPNVEKNIDGRISGEVQLLRSGEDVFFLGTVAGTLHMQCSRCLTDFDIQKQIDFNMVIRSRGAESSVEKKDDEDEEGVFFIEGLEFDPVDIIAQEFILEIPMKPLCREECPGLCSKCGALKGSCSCPEEHRKDPRWESLAKLKEKMHK
ncbi:MAG TPA: YceD family protein [Desulfomonilaceae bacterium]|nr:YceD family protein [Desulfomonilaceae bacterium]